MVVDFRSSPPGRFVLQKAKAIFLRIVRLKCFLLVYGTVNAICIILFPMLYGFYVVLLFVCFYDVYNIESSFPSIQWFSRESES